MNPRSTRLLSKPQSFGTERGTRRAPQSPGRTAAFEGPERRGMRRRSLAYQFVSDEQITADVRPLRAAVERLRAVSCRPRPAKKQLSLGDGASKPARLRKRVIVKKEKRSRSPPVRVGRSPNGPMLATGRLCLHWAQLASVVGFHPRCSAEACTQFCPRKELTEPQSGWICPIIESAVRFSTFEESFPSWRIRSLLAIAMAIRAPRPSLPFPLGKKMVRGVVPTRLTGIGSRYSAMPFGKRIDAKSITDEIRAAWERCNLWFNKFGNCDARDRPSWRWRNPSPGYRKAGYSRS